MRIRLRLKQQRENPDSAFMIAPRGDLTREETLDIFNFQTEMSLQLARSGFEGDEEEREY